MRFALVNDLQVEAQPGLRAFCRVCAKPVTAKCGDVRVWHWSHTGKRNCDKWWEPETEWHRRWKNHFSKDWQEAIRHDGLNEKHIADVMTQNGLVVEFQHSAIAPEERKAREVFYGDMVWVVDGSRLKNDYSRFRKRKNNFDWADHRGKLFHVDNPENCLPIAWLECSVPVIFDFRAMASPEDIIPDSQRLLYCLFPGRIGDKAVLAAFTDATFIESVISGRWSNRVKERLEIINKQDLEERLRMEKFRLQAQLIDWHKWRLGGL